VIDEYLAQLRAALRVPRRRRDRILDDVGDHLADAADRLQQEGLDPDVARQRAISAFGPAMLIAEQINRDAAIATVRRAPLAMAASGVVVVAGFLIATVAQPSPGLPKPAGLVRQIAFFAGIVGLQLAVVAGGRVLARAAARWRTRPTWSDLGLVRRATFVFLGGLLATTTGWTIALVDAVGGLPNGRLAPLVAGLVMMIGASLAAILGCARWRRTVESALAAPEADGSDMGNSVLAMPERIIRAMAAQPWLFGASAALLAALAVMSWAETTVVGALPWGAAEAAVVAVGYVWLGPALELRT
jgi:hypothetical protein